jgi:hypothetical protein
MRDAVQKLLRSLRDGSYREHTFPKLEWTDIPALLERAESTASLKSIPCNPLSSMWQTECTEGMAILWLIEGVRKGGQVPSLNPLCFKSAGDKGAKKRWTEASEDNHAELARAYRAWWQKIQRWGPKGGAIVDPLKGTGLHWY